MAAETSQPLFLQSSRESWGLGGSCFCEVPGAQEFGGSSGE